MTAAVVLASSSSLEVAAKGKRAKSRRSARARVTNTDAEAGACDEEAVEEAGAGAGVEEAVEEAGADEGEVAVGAAGVEVDEVAGLVAGAAARGRRTRARAPASALKSASKRTASQRGGASVPMLTEGKVVRRGIRTMLRRGSE